MADLNFKPTKWELVVMDCIHQNGKCYYTVKIDNEAHWFNISDKRTVSEHILDASSEQSRNFTEHDWKTTLKSIVLQGEQVNSQIAYIRV